MDAAGVAQDVAGRLGSGKRDTLILGETHSVPQEKAAVDVLLNALLASGRPVGALLTETTDVISPQGEERRPLMASADRLVQAGATQVKLLNLVRPDAELAAAIKAARGKLLVTYTGNAHAGQRIYEYIFNELGDSIGAFRKGGLAMVSVEQAARARGRHPVVVSMIAESYFREKTAHFMLEAIAKGGGTPAELRAELAAAASAWEARFPSEPPASTDIRFVPFPGSPDLIVGLTPDAGHSGGDLEAAVRGLDDPALQTWLGGRMIATLDVTRSSEGFRIAATSDDGRTYVGVAH